VEGRGQRSSRNSHPRRRRSCRGRASETKSSSATTEAAEQRKAVEAERQKLAKEAEAVSTERQRYAQTLQTLAQKLYAQDPLLTAEAQTDWPKLWETAPAEAGRRQALVNQRIGQINAFVGNLAKEHEELQGKMQSEHAEKLKKHLEKEEAELLKKVPSGPPPRSGPKAIAELRKGLVERYGYQPQEVAVIGDHRHALIVKDALAYHTLKAEVDAERAKAKADGGGGQGEAGSRPAPKVARPGNANDPRAPERTSAARPS
jgi:hypothetical protein